MASQSSSTEQIRKDFQFEEQENYRTGKSCCKTFLFFALAVTGMVAVGLIVHFTRPPCSVCSTSGSVDDQWEKCKALAAEKDECLCATEAPTTVPPPPPTPKPKVTGLRLNKTLIPVHYNVELKPDIYLPNPSFVIDGHVEIWMRCDDVTDRLVLQMATITLAWSTIEFREEGPEGRLLEYERFEEDTDRQFFLLHLREDLTQGGMYYFRTEFEGTLKQATAEGFYESSYMRNNKKVYLASTQFQATHARKAFPCFDEPTFKSTFNITLVRQPEYTALSNMDVLYTEPRGGGYVADVFAQTIRMPTYLLAFAVFDFAQKNKTTEKGTFVRNWGRPDYIDQVDYALNITGPILEAFENYTDQPFQLLKTDQIAVSRFPAGAMENWGLIVYLESEFYYNPAFSKAQDMMDVARLVAHEVSHQWFGNLVTCDWWDDTFLNEALASYFEVYGVQSVHMTWDMVVRSMHLTLYAMEVDSYSNSLPIRLVNLEHHDDIDRVFSTITYLKGAAVIRMVNFFLSKETFRRAMQQYLRDHMYQTVKYYDFYNALENQARLENKVTWDQSLTNISGIMTSWIDQPGVPVVKISRLGGGKYRISQKRFLFGSEGQTTPGQTWHIPFTYSEPPQLRAKQYTFQWLHDKEAVLDGLGNSFILGNFESHGYYRVDYDDETLARIIDQLNTDHELIPEYNRGQLIQDIVTFTRNGERSDTDILRVTQYLVNETAWLPWLMGLGRFRFYERMFYNTETYEAWHQYQMSRVVTNVYGHVGWEASDDNPWTANLRARILDKACSGGYGPCIDKAREYYKKWMDNPGDNPIHPGIRKVVYCTAIRTGGRAEWEFAYKMYEKQYNGYIGSEKSVLGNALTCSRQPWILQSGLDKAVETGDGEVIAYIATNPVGASLVWDLLLTKSIKPSTRLLSLLTNSYSTNQDLKKFEINANMISTNETKQMFKSVRQEIQKNIDWMSKNEKPVRAWLEVVNDQLQEAMPISLELSQPEEPEPVQPVAPFTLM